MHKQFSLQTQQIKTSMLKRNISQASAADADCFMLRSRLGTHVCFGTYSTTLSYTSNTTPQDEAGKDTSCRWGRTGQHSDLGCLQMQFDKIEFTFFYHRNQHRATSKKSSWFKDKFLEKIEKPIPLGKFKTISPTLATFLSKYCFSVFNLRGYYTFRDRNTFTPYFWETKLISVM